MHSPVNPLHSKPAHILVIDDEPDLRTLYELALLREGYKVEAAGDLAQARQQLQEKSFDAVITDMRLPDGLGLELLRDMVQQQRPERCVVITAHGSAENAVAALKAGAFDYLTKPVDLKQFRSVVASAIQGSKTAALLSANKMMLKDTYIDAARLTPQQRQGKAPPLVTSALACLVGQSAVMQAVKSRILKVAGSMAPVLIQGESGTGKELIAKAVHGCSHRANGPFVAVNCGAIPENLLESEFFGARKGAYTGSTQDRQGYFQAAKGGTLFLDEIGDLPLAMQSKFLRAIQERMVRPLGSSQEDAVDVRIVSATHKDLSVEVEAGRFRQDLYYRLNVIVISAPPLRDRREDLPELCNALLSKICQDSGLNMPVISDKLMAQLQPHPFNGNVRELENLLHRALAMCEGGELLLDAPAVQYVAVPAPPYLEVPENLQNYLDAQERVILCQVLDENHFNCAAAAEKLGLSLRQIHYRIARLNISMPDNHAAIDSGDSSEKHA